ncbi:ammonium transporter 2 [Rhizophagus irregularis]|uniref:Ammonium transporter n=4 Tax=Rhizophagus TaxID=1129544 RepID=A0A2I1E0Q4_9GLOM|nr:ammonium transporter 2 [Rhizophagus irregularis DAOM 181602=DAOM 197198]EXX70281.1 Mep2p [Rhizophagus irregularis DAOM 197198w]PKC08243.1 ammonium transporter 2 [Rhizophagus irregularis]CAX32490.2 ammonium transporter 2 [Rhizophagus intraradices]PKC63776.1 ammonium transporter 2 [Rhizophagus irregularis]PKY15704.1 ammonium transporter 2 [Rhizophagus irregularis]|eukprot:XP_025183237.1 ammonium transporter 2 [Rhizophagus irregularis DAOM 181602=DAOM 197198]
MSTATPLDDSMLVENKYFPGDIAWVLVSTGLVWLMIPGVGFFYSGMARSKNALSLILLCVLCGAVVTVQWFIIGYSLTFSTNGNGFIGNVDHAFFRNLKGNPSFASQRIPDILYAVYQGMFASVTPALAIGAAAERARVVPLLIFVFVWTTLVYDVIASWSWSEKGWYAQLGGLDFAGGTPVHITSGAAALAYCIKLGKRHGHGTDEFKPHNVANVILGTTMLWFGWFGFNGGSANAANIRAIMALTSSNLAASVGGITWMLIDYRLERKLSALGFCSGAVAGLVCVTPGSGYINVPSAIAFGIVGGTSCNFAVKLKHLLDFDDALDVFAVHGVGGICGNILTGIFAQKEVAALGGQVIQGGWLDGHWVQILYQLADSCAGLAYSFCVTYMILFIMDKIPGLHLRVDIEAEEQGIDDTELGELAYYHVDRLAGLLNSNYLNNSTNTSATMTNINSGKLPIQQGTNQYILS